MLQSREFSGALHTYIIIVTRAKLHSLIVISQKQYYRTNIRCVIIVFIQVEKSKFEN